MKRWLLSARSFFGVTLLEIMLVLAIAAMIIVMSVRYYQSATAAQQANSTLEQIQAIVAAVDSLSQATGTYSTITASTLKSVLPDPPGLKSAWGGAIDFAAVTGKITLTLASTPKNVAPLITSKLAANSRYTGTAYTPSSKALVVVYSSG